jgi:MFS family permease
MSETAAAGTPDTAAGPGPVPLRRNSGFQLLWIGQLLSDTGSEMGMIAYPLLILALTHSPVLAGVVGTAREIALICLQLPAGALADRFDRRITMIACDTLRAGLLAVLGILIAVHLASWPVVLLVSLIEGAAGGLFDPSAAAALPAIVADEQLVQAWAATEGRTWAASLAGPALGGLLFGLGRAVPFLADAVSYAASFGTVSRIRGRFRPEQAPERKALWREVADGLRLAWQVPLLRAVLAMTVGGTLLFAVAAVVIPSPLVALPVAIVVLLAPAGNAGLYAIMLRRVPEEMRGRVTSTVTMAAMALATLAPLLAGLLVEHVSASWAIGAFAAAEAIAAVLTLVMPGLRDADM